MFHIEFLCILSNAFLKSMKLINAGRRNLALCSMMSRNVKICSLHDLPLRNLACSSHKLFFTASFISLSITMQKIWPGTERSVTSLQLWHSLVLLFFDFLTIMPFLQPSRMLSVSQHMFNSFVLTCNALTHPCLTSSAKIWSSPAVLLFLSDSVGFSVSASVIISRFASTSVATVKVLMSKVVIAFGWVSVSLQYSIQRVSCSSFVSRSSPFLTLIGVLILPLDPLSSLTNRYVCCFL